MELGKKWVAAAVAPVSRIARALLVSRQSLYKPQRIRQAVRRPRPRPVMRDLDLDVPVGPEHLTPEETRPGAGGGDALDRRLQHRAPPPVA